ncbi:hypothetical protein [Ruegeria sp. EL01]|jgi:hypothetical protein|uniref:hypothetical protein n=1 Tax=Ruegeria sp. EL01 TaxID=2107578 RepID=UPI000EA8203B|nr:hypothetical protein [Ruegeria sp. EL01]
MYNRQNIMNRAWAIMANRPFHRVIWRNALWQAWGEAKEAVRRASMTEADHIREAMSLLDNKDTWTEADYRKREELVAALAVAQGHEAKEQAYAEKRALISKAKGRFVSVTFTKQDGTQRTMRVQPATLRQHVKGDAASNAARKAIETRTRRHPHLLPVWDTEAQAPRSVNLATVSRIAADGNVHTFS